MQLMHLELLGYIELVRNDSSETREVETAVEKLQLTFIDYEKAFGLMDQINYGKFWKRDDIYGS
jgi:hypothetical protein